MRAPNTLRRLLAAARLNGESRNAQAARMGFSEASLRLYERGVLPHGNTIPALARALGVGEVKLRRVIEAERTHRPKRARFDTNATVDEDSATEVRS